MSAFFFIWVFRPLIFNAIIDMAGFTFDILFFVFGFLPFLFVCFSDLSLNDWVCYFNSFTVYFTSSLAPNQVSHWVQSRGFRSSQLVLIWQNLYHLQGVGHVQFYSCFLRRGFDDLFNWPLPECPPAIYF